jgi:class 3 adenylate cyclase/ABC-type uncharacterized transport system substrate-binding protein
VSPERVGRKLAAILAADVAGYSRLMGADEEGTLARLKNHRHELVDPKISEHHGRIVKTTGDGMLVEFGSVVDAVRCAVEIQRGMVERNADVPAGRRIDFRIGINVGDVIIDGGDIFGDGVNVAARLEALAEPGGICVSARVYEDATGRIDARFEDIGKQSLKNINRPVRVYRVRGRLPELDDREIAQIPKPASDAAIPIGKTLRNVGYLATGPRPGYDEFRRALAAYGHIDGETVTIHTRWSEGVQARFSGLAQELITLGVDLILAVAGPAVVAAKQATHTIPIVMVEVGDPVGYGIVSSLMRPGGNVTGMSNAMHEFMPRSLRLLKEIVPNAVRVVVLAPHRTPGVNAMLRSIEEVAHALATMPRIYNASTADDLQVIVAELDRQNCDVIVVLPDHGLAVNRSVVLAASAELRVPVISALPDYARDGALLSIGPNRSEVFRRAAYYADAIFKGTPPSALPIEEVTKESLLINLKTAKALGITIPAPILMRADELIE